ncbi:hypothetical protein Kpho01_68750 [Kitasatospora phosalacinea]|uniref:Uncharacterized protein n=1 Tax=Kitasatospora phosalacinea TaxID=2065 RepID=A0A9W6PM85_9ACTN|nr:hypothetical protein Kpho01_68750 [Kitasatospora phosalacinea]
MVAGSSTSARGELGVLVEAGERWAPGRAAVGAGVCHVVAEVIGVVSVIAGALRQVGGLGAG